MRPALFAALAGGCLLLPGPARGAEPEAAPTSLRLVPADAAFYSAMLRNREQVEAVAHSRAWSKLWALPSVQQGWKALQGEYKRPDGRLAPLRQALADEDNQELLALLTDAASDEVFVYGDDAWSGLIDLYMEASAATQFKPAMAQMEGVTDAGRQNQMVAHALLSVLARDPERIKIPLLVFGFKVSDARRAEKQIQRLETLAEAVAEQAPQFKGRVKRTKVGDDRFLTLTVDGSQVPWNNIPWDKVEQRPGEFKALARKLKSLTLTVSLGVRQGYLLLAVGPAADALSRFGGDGPRLDGRDEFKPLTKFAGRKLTSIDYVSKVFARSGGAGYYADSLTDMARAGLAKADLTDAQRKEFLKDLAALTEGMKKAGADAGARMDFTFLTDRGFEGYAYDHGRHEDLDASKPLTLLDHLGGSPLVAVVSRGKVGAEDYENAVRGLKTVYKQLDEAFADKLTGDAKERYAKAKEDFLPLLKRLDETTGKLLLPALADGQTALVLDAKWKSKRWVKALPRTEEALPMPEIGLVFGVSDAAKLREAMAEYRRIVNDGLAKLKDWPGVDKSVADLRIPEPKSKKGESGTLYFYPLPKEPGVDPRVAPTAGLSDDTAVLTVSQGHAERLLKREPLKVEGGPLAERDRPLAAAVYVDFAGFIDALTPWAEYGAAQTLGDAPAREREAVTESMRTALEVLKCLRGVTSATTLEDGVLVTHSEMVFRDLEK